ncbi:MAG: alpha/beta hydrolase [Pseudomonadota bacterium]
MSEPSAAYATSLTRKVSVNGTDFTYRVTGSETDMPIVCLNHLAGNLDNWDPRVIDGLARRHKVIVFNNRGVASSKGKTPSTVDEMADDAIAFIKALGYDQVDILGFSLGGAVAQTAVLKEPGLFRKIILAGIGPKGGIGISDIPTMAYKNQLRALLSFNNVLTYLFFTRTENGKAQAKAFLRRLKERTKQRDKSVSLGTFRKQLAAISDYAAQRMPDFSKLDHPVLVANGESDVMVPSVNSAHLHLAIPGSKLILYKDAGHGGIFQHHDAFVQEALSFFASSSERSSSVL